MIIARPWPPPTHMVSTGSPRILSGGGSISACARRPTGIVFLVRCARWPLAARRLHSRSVRPRRNHGARPCGALLAWIYRTEVPAGLPASITGRRVDLRAHERTAESTAGDSVAAAVTGICNRCIRHAARHRGQQMTTAPDRSRYLMRVLKRYRQVYVRHEVHFISAADRGDWMIISRSNGLPGPEWHPRGQ
jgi:hypothetical protein